MYNSHFTYWQQPFNLADNEGDWQAWSLARLCLPPMDTHETQILARRRGIDSKNQPEKGCTQGTQWFSPSTSFVLSLFLYFSVYDWSEEKLHIVVLLHSLTHTHTAHPGRAVHHDPLTFAHACYTCAKHANSAQHRCYMPCFICYSSTQVETPS